MRSVTEIMNIFQVQFESIICMCDTLIPDLSILLETLINDLYIDIIFIDYIV